MNAKAFFLSLQMIKMLLYKSGKLKLGLILLTVMLYNSAYTQSTVVLPANNNISSLVSPQGAVKYQRQFYLIKGEEIQRSGLQNGMTVNAIGFNIAVPQSISTKGLFRVYLQNTTDIVSRMDTAWTELNVTSNVFYLNNLFAGDYEWQVRSNCNTNSVFSPSAYYTLNADSCKLPTHQLTTNITTVAARFQWTLPAYNINTFKVEYSKRDVENWTTVNTTDNFYDATGLTPGESYQWRVSSVCVEDSSKPELTYFETAPTNNCNAPSNLSASIINDTTAGISWVAAGGADRYEIYFRRSGTSTWTSTVSLGNTSSLPNLKKGTNYEWKVRTICNSTSYGGFVSGPDFLTTGAQSCYPPENLISDSLTDSKVKLSWAAASGASSYQLRYRLKETISWTNAIAGMTTAHNDSITIPATAGRYDIDFAGGTAFDYSGEGIYVAYEYIDSNNALSSRNTSLANYEANSFKDTAGRDSANIVLSLGMVSKDSLPLVLSASQWRPETWLSSGSLNDSVAVLAVYANGQQAIPYGNPATISALLKNFTNTDKTYTVTLQVKDENAIKHSEQLSATVKADSILVMQFAEWSSSQIGKDSVIVSIDAQPGENVLNNNRNFYIQNVNKTLLSYEDGTGAISATGMDTATGIIMAKHTMNGCGAITGAQVFLDESAAGHPVYAVIVDMSGTILSSSATYTPETNFSGYYSFYFPAPVKIDNGTSFFIGLAQPDISTGYFPVGVQYEFGYTRTEAYYRANLDGTGIEDHPEPGRLMIRAEIVPEGVAPYILGDPLLCAGTSKTLNAAGVVQQFANSVIDYSSQNSTTQFGAIQTLGSPDVYPQSGINTNAWMSSSGDDQREHLVLGYANPDSINFIDVYEIYNPGSIDTVYVKNAETDEFSVVYTNTVDDSVDSVAHLLHIAFPLTLFKVSEVRIAMNSPEKTGYSSIDAVAIGRIDSVPTFTAYTWTHETTGGPVIVGNTESLTTSDSGRYVLSVQTSGGCSASTEIVLTTPSQVLPVITAGGPISFCIGDSVKLRSDKKGGNVWSTGATTDSIYVSASGNYWVEYNDGTGCGALRSASVAVNVNALPVVTITGQTGICAGSTTTLTASATGAGNQYAWSDGTSTADAIVSIPSAISVMVTDANGCKASANTTTFRAPNPAPKIKGIPGFCSGSSTTLNIANTFTSYLWKDGSTGKSSTISTTGKQYITVKNTFGCEGSDTVEVIQFPGPTPSITGNLSICAGKPTTLNAGGGYGSYAWSTGETTQIILVTEPGLYAVIVKDGNTCAGTANARTIKDSLPPRPGLIGGVNAGVCNSPGTSFSIQPVQGATHYVWLPPAGATIVSGQGSTDIVLSFDNTFSSGSLEVSASNACGQSGDLLPRLLPLNVIPGKPAGITGRTTGVCNSTQRFSIPEIPLATSYVWTIPAGSSIVSGQGTNMINVSFSSTFAGGTVCVKSINSCGQSDPSCLAVHGTPEMPLSISGPAMVCYKDKDVTYSTGNVYGAVSYTWTVPQNASIISGQGTSVITVKFGSKSGNITVAANSACGPGAAKAMYVTADNCPGIVSTGTGRPAFTATAPVLLSPEVLATGGDVSTLNNIQLEWTLGEPVIETVQSGTQWYTQGFHQPLIVLPAIVKETGLPVRIAIAPNPTLSILNVNITAEKDEMLTLHLTDVNGQVLIKRTIPSGTKTIQLDLSRYSNGIYLLRVENRAGTIKQTFKVAKVS